MSYTITFDYNEMVGTIKMEKELGGITLTLTASAPPKKISHFIIPGDGTTVEANTISAHIAAEETTVTWRILALGEFMENYKVKIDFASDAPKVILERGVQKLVPTRVEYEPILGYEFTAPSSAHFKMYKRNGKMKLKYTTPPKLTTLHHHR